MRSLIPGFLEQARRYYGMMMFYFLHCFLTSPVLMNQSMHILNQQLSESLGRERQRMFVRLLPYAHIQVSSRIQRMRDALLVNLPYLNRLAVALVRTDMLNESIVEMSGRPIHSQCRDYLHGRIE
jgi:hypothetical protein